MAVAVTVVAIGAAVVSPPFVTPTATLTFCETWHRGIDGMGLAIEVGVLSYLVEHDAEGAEWVAEELGKINEALKTGGLPTHSEPKTLPPLKSRCSTDSYPYSFLHFLRRVVARRLNDPGWLATPVVDGEDPADDPIVGRELQTMRSHVICHSDAEGYYLPIDFDEVVFVEDESVPGGGIVGSSQRVLEELITVAPALGIVLNGSQLSDAEAQRIDAETDEAPLFVERLVWLSLFEAARLSVEHRTAIRFS